MIDEGELLAGRYRLVEQVGTGAMGVVWKAHDEHLNRVVAVKQLLHAAVNEAGAEEANRRAMREARITARLNHPHAIAVYDMVEHERRPYLIMEYLRSESLSTVLAERGPLPPAEVARIGSQIAAALAAAHEVGIVHRDIKPGNVLIADDGTAKITDFGISRAAGDCTVTATGVLLGTPAYLAPEVARGQQADFPADVFALGSTLYAAVEGRPPFGVDDNPLALLYRIVNNEIIPPERSGPLTSVLSWLLDCDLTRRPTMQQARQALATAPTAPTLLPPADAVTATDEPSAAGDSVTLDVSPSSASGSSATASLSARSLSARISAPTVNVASAGQGSARGPAAEGSTRSRRPAAGIAVAAASLLVVGFMLVATLINHRSDATGPPADTPSTTPGVGQDKQAPRSPPAANDAAGTVPVVATIPGAAPAVNPEPNRVSPSGPSPAPPSSPSGVPPSHSSATSSPESTPEPTQEDARAPNPDPSQVPDPALGPVPSPEPTPNPNPNPNPAPGDDLAPSPPSDGSGR